MTIDRGAAASRLHLGVTIKSTPSIEVALWLWSFFFLWTIGSSLVIVIGLVIGAMLAKFGASLPAVICGAVCSAGGLFWFLCQGCASAQMSGDREFPAFGFKVESKDKEIVAVAEEEHTEATPTT